LVALPSSGLRAAAIDIGTNSILLTVAEWQDGGYKVLVDRATVTRLGEGVDRTRRLAPAAIGRSLECLRDYATEIAAARVTRLDVVGTSALRDATAADDFLGQAECILGFRPRVIDGPEEARLTCLGALSGLRLDGPFVVVDVGGGSTEVIVGRRDGAHVALEAFTSLDIGCVRLTERHLLADPPSQTELDDVTMATMIALRSLPFDVTDGTLVGVAGTVTTLGAMHLGLASYDPARVHGTHLTLEIITEQRRTLSKLNHSQRGLVPGLHEGRTDVIVAGTIIVEQLLRLSNRNALLISDRGVRYGLLSNLFRDVEALKQS
jgi:exopolyphosphatase/guanosine-5'-triphosphate,3'-diphosphate pyrophosphatase